MYRSLRRLTELGLVDRWWEDQDIATASGRPRRRLYALNQHGRDACPHASAVTGCSAARRHATRTASPHPSSTSRLRQQLRPEAAVGADDGQLCFAAKLTIWKYTVSTFCAYPGSVAQLPLPITFHVGVRPLAKNVS